MISNEALPNHNWCRKIVVRQSWVQGNYYTRSQNCSSNFTAFIRNNKKNKNMILYEYQEADADFSPQ